MLLSCLSFSVFIPFSNICLPLNKTQELYLSLVWFSWVLQIFIEVISAGTELHTGDTGEDKTDRNFAFMEFSGY